MKTGIPSPARSQEAPTTPRRYITRRTRSGGSPSRSNVSGRLSTLAHQLQEEELGNFVPSPMSRCSVLNDNTNIELPQRQSWWKKLDETMGEVVTEQHGHNVAERENNILEDYIQSECEVLSQEKKNYTLDLPESSDSDTIVSIVIPQRKLFTGKDIPKHRFGKVIGARESLTKHQKSKNIEKSIHVSPKKIFGEQNRQKSMFPANIDVVEKDTFIENIEQKPHKIFGNKTTNNMKVAIKKNMPENILESTENVEEPAGIPTTKHSACNIGLSKTVMPFNVSKNKTVEPNVSKEMAAAEARIEKHNLFGNKASTKRKNIFADFKLYDSEEEISEIETQTWKGFRRSVPKTRRSSASHGLKDVSLASNVTTDIEMDFRKMLPSSTMISDKLEELAAGTPVKKKRLSILAPPSPLEVIDENLTANNIRYVDIDEQLNQSVGHIEQEDEEVYQSEEQIEEHEELYQCELQIKENEEEELNGSKIKSDDENLDLSVAEDGDINKTGIQQNEEDQREIETNDDNKEGANISDKKLKQENSKESDTNHTKSENPPKEISPLEVVDENLTANNIRYVDIDEQLNQSVGHIEEDEELYLSEEQIEENEEEELNESKIQSDDENLDLSVAEDDDINKTGIQQNEEDKREIETNDDNKEEANISDKKLKQENSKESDTNHTKSENPPKEISPLEVIDENLTANNIRYVDIDEQLNQSVGHIEEEDEEVYQSEDQIEEDEELYQSEEQIEENEEEELNESKIKSDDVNLDQSNDENPLKEITVSPNVTQDTTGRHRKNVNETKVETPEQVVCKNISNFNESITSRGRNNNIRKTSSMNPLEIRPSIACVRDSIESGGSDFSAQGSGWDSHRTTRKTLRQTFGKDFTPRKSLRTLVMEKSAKRQTEVEQLSKKILAGPLANSTEIVTEHSDHHVNNEEFSEVSDHEESRANRLEELREKLIRANIERKEKIIKRVEASLNSASRTGLDQVFKAPLKPSYGARSGVKATKVQSKKPIKRSAVTFGELPVEFREELKYKPPKRFAPSDASWATKRLYKYLETKLEPRYDYMARVRAEKLVQSIYNFTKFVRRHDKVPSDIIDDLKREMARLKIVRTHYDFYQFFHDFMPREIRTRVNPDAVNKYPLPRGGVFSDIIPEGDLRA